MSENVLNKDWQRQKVDVICQFTKEGQVIPMRMRVCDDEGMLQTYSIKSFRDLTEYSGTIMDYIFDCKIQVLDRLIPIKLYFHNRDGYWTI